MSGVSQHRIELHGFLEKSEWGLGNAARLTRGIGTTSRLISIHPSVQNYLNIPARECHRRCSCFSWLAFKSSKSSRNPFNFPKNNDLRPALLQFLFFCIFTGGHSTAISMHIPFFIEVLGGGVRKWTRLDLIIGHCVECFKRSEDWMWLKAKPKLQKKLNVWNVHLFFQSFTRRLNWLLPSSQAMSRLWFSPMVLMSDDGCTKCATVTVSRMMNNIHANCICEWAIYFMNLN